MGALVKRQITKNRVTLEIFLFVRAPTGWGCGRGDHNHITLAFSYQFSITYLIVFLLSLKYNNFFTGFLPCVIWQEFNFFFQEDLYYPHPLIQDILWATLDKVVEPLLMHWPGKKLREKALHTAIEHIHYEDENTRYICIGPVNKVGIQRFAVLLFFV